MFIDQKSIVAFDKARVDEAKAAALGVLLHNARGPFEGLPRTAGWGYPEPYTRDLMISALGFLTTGNHELADALRRTLVALACNQTTRGHIPSLAHDAADRGASDTTPLFLFGLALYRRSANLPGFLDEAARKALTWMEYRSPDDMVMVSQLPTSDWRDEQWVMGYGLYVNTLVYGYLRLYGEHESAGLLGELMNRLEVLGEAKNPHQHEGLVVPTKPYYALYSYKIFNSDRFDLLGNSLAILTGIAPPDRAKEMVAWVETECDAMRLREELAVDLPPCLFPYMLPHHADWRSRYERYNRPGEYHNGGVWPFVGGMWVRFVHRLGLHDIARNELVKLARVNQLGKAQAWEFNEWVHGTTGRPMGKAYQAWSAAAYLKACQELQVGADPEDGD